MLYKQLSQAIGYAHTIGLTTSIITNGSLLTERFLDNHIGLLDWIGLSVDSLEMETNHQIGRINMSGGDYMLLVDRMQERLFRLKINTVVNAYNKHENMQRFINYANPDRWKIFQALRVEGQNDIQFHKVSVTAPEFDAYVSRHQHPNMVVEDNEAMTGSYLLIDPRGRLFENSKGFHTYSQPLYQSTLEECLAEISLDRKQFLKRGGIYDW